MADRCIASKNTWTGILPLKKVRRLQGFALTNQLWEISSLQNWYSTKGAACRFFKSASCRTRFAPTEASTAPCLWRRKGVFRTNGEVGNWKEWILGELITFLQNWKSTKIPTWSTCTIWTIIMDALSKILYPPGNVSISHQTSFSRKIIDSKVLEPLREILSFPETNRKFTPWKKNGWFRSNSNLGLPSQFSVASYSAVRFGESVVHSSLQTTDSEKQRFDRFAIFATGPASLSQISLNLEVISVRLKPGNFSGSRHRGGNSGSKLASWNRTPVDMDQKLKFMFLFIERSCTKL